MAEETAMPFHAFTRRGLVTTLLAVASCAPAVSSSPGSRADGRSVITREDLADTPQLTAYEAIRRLRPAWLRYRGQSVLSGPDREGLRIYLDGAFYGDATALGQIIVNTVQEIRFLDSRQATLRYGTGHTVGAIAIATRKGGEGAGG